MNLEIKEITFDKEEYIFGIDKTSKINFNLYSNNNDIYIEDVSIRYGGNFIFKTLLVKDSFSIDKKIDIGGKFTLLSGEYKKFNIDLKIDYFNYTNENTELPVKINQYFEVLINGKSISGKKYINVILDKNFYFIENNKFNEHINIISSLLTNSFISKDSLLKNSINYEISKKNIDFFKENKLDYLFNDFGYYPFRKAGPFSSKNDFINNDFYNFILKKSSKYNYFDKLFNKKIFLPILIAIYLLLIFLYNYFDSFLLEHLFYLIIFVSFGYFILLYILNLYFIGYLIKQFYNISFSKINSYKLLKNINNVSDIFDNLSIDYNGKYFCSFDVNIKFCYNVTSNYGKKNISYIHDIYSLNIASYNGSNLNKNNIILNKNNINLFNNTYFNPGTIYNNYSLSSNIKSFSFFYRIEYNLLSNDIINDNGFLDIYL